MKRSWLGSGGGGIPFLSFNDDGPIGGGGGSGGSWDSSALAETIAKFVYREFQEARDNAKNRFYDIKHKIQPVIDQVSGIRELAIGGTAGGIWRDKGGQIGGGFFAGLHGGGTYSTTGDPIGDLNAFLTIGISVQLYKGPSPTGIVNNFNLGLAKYGGFSLAYDNNVNFAGFAIGYRGPAAGIAWTRDATTATCYILCR